MRAAEALVLALALAGWPTHASILCERIHEQMDHRQVAGL